MKFNSMTRENEKKKDYSKYIMWAVVLAFVCSLFIRIIAKLVVMASKVIYKYWYVAVALVLIILFMRRRRRRKK